MGLLLFWNGTAQPAATVTMPDIRVEMALDSDPLADPIWTDVSSRFRSAKVRRGRQRETERIQAGTMAVVLSNADRQLDPQYGPGSFFGKLTPMKRIRLWASYDNVHYIFDGYVDSIRQEYVNPNDAVAVIRATDGFKALSRGELAVSVYAAEVASDEPVHWFRFNEEIGTTDFVVNSGSSGIPGIVITSPDTPTFGAVGLAPRDSGRAMELVEGDDTGIYLDAAQAVITGVLPNFTIEMWVNSTNPGATGAYFEQGVSSTVSRVQIGITSASGNHIFFTIFNSAGTSFVAESTVGITDAITNYIACRSQGGVMKIFIGGNDRTSGTPTWSGSIDAGRTDVGFSRFLGGSSVGGRLDEVAVYDLALSDLVLSIHADTTPWGSDASGNRVNRILNLLGWGGMPGPPDTDASILTPVNNAFRDIDTGEATLLSADLDTSALAHLQAVEEAEDGRLFMSKDGKVVFKGRHDILNPTSLHTWGEAGGADLPHIDLAYDYTDEQLRNDVTVTRRDGATAAARDATSIAAFGHQVFSLSAQIFRTDAEAVDRANALVNRYKDPINRVDDVMLNPRKDPATLFPAVLVYELGNAIRVKRLPQGVGSAIDEKLMIEGIVHDIGTMSWETVLSLSPIGASTYLQLDSADNPVTTPLGSSRLAH